MTEQTIAMPSARVAVLANAKLVEVVLPTELPLREIIPALLRLVGAEQQSPSDPLSLAPVGGSPFSLDATLDTVGVVDGDLLALRPVPLGPAAPGIVEDVADAAVIFSESRRRPWNTAHLGIAARVVAIGLVLVSTALSVLYHVAVGGLGGLFVAAGLCAIAMLGGLLAATRSLRISAELSAAALAPIAAAFAMAVQGDPSTQVLLAAAGVAAWSLICLFLGTTAIAGFSAAAAVGLGVMVAAGIAAVWEVSLRSIGCGLIVLALIVTVRTPQLAAMCARFPLPTIPAPGDPVPQPPALPVLTDLPRRVRSCDAYQSGFISAAVVLAVLGSLAIALDAPGPWGWYVIVATALAAVLRARIWDSAPCKAWLLAHPLLLGIALLTVFAIDSRYDAAWWTLVALAAQAVVWVVVAMNPRIAAAETYSLPARRAVGFLAAGVDASLIPVIVYLLGLSSWVLNR